MTELGKVMVVPKGAYNANTTYEILDLVTYNGSSYIALKSTKGNVPTNTTYWQLHGQGYPGAATGVSAKDTQGMVVTAGSNSTVQALIDAIADRVMTKLFAKADIVQTESTSTTKVPSSAYLKQVKDDINSNFDKYYSLSDAIQIPSGADLNNYTDFGNYVSSAASISSTLQNCPALNGGFVLHVERVTGATDGTFLKQRIIYNEAKSLEFWRVKTGKESWSSWVSPITNADYNAQSITNQYGFNLHLVKFGNDNLKVIRLSGYINKTLTAGTEYIIASNVSLKSRVDWYHNVFVSGKGSELTVYLNIDNDGNVKITPKTAIASGTAINMMEYYV